jgi:hypothetical protein
MGQSNPELRDALKRLSAAKFGRPRAEVEQAFFKRLGAGDAAKKEKMDALKKAQQERMAALQQNRPGIPPGGFGAPAGVPGAPQAASAPASGSSFLDEWLAKRQQISSVPKPGGPAPNPAFGPTAGMPASTAAVEPLPRIEEPASDRPVNEDAPKKEEPVEESDHRSDEHHEKHKLHVQDSVGGHDEVSVKLR